MGVAGLLCPWFTLPFHLTMVRRDTWFINNAMSYRCIATGYIVKAGIIQGDAAGAS
jgi:hypothetical protein